jgi:hypothetical protein
LAYLAGFQGGIEIENTSLKKKIARLNASE